MELWIQPTRTRSGEARVQQTLVVLAQRLMQSLIRIQQRRTGISLLRLLDNRQLRDLGISRSEIEFAVRHGHPREMR